MAAEENGSKVVERKLGSLIYRLGRVDGMRSSREKDWTNSAIVVRIGSRSIEMKVLVSYRL